MLYIDVCTYNDYDKVIKLLLENNIDIIERNKVKMIISAEISVSLLAKLLEAKAFEGIVFFGEDSLN